MSRKSAAVAVSEGQPTRRQFLKTSATVTGGAIAAPTIIPSSALGLDGAVPPSERIVVGGIGIGRRGGLAYHHHQVETMIAWSSSHRRACGA